MIVLLFFFFQAEDGIRDFTVTGVQTCALPIWLRPISLPAPRGIITDRNGKILAENLTGYAVSLLPAEDEDSLEATLRRMAPIVKLDGPAIERLLTRYRRTPYLPVTVLPNATFEVVSALEERRLIFPGLLIQPEPRRHYPDSSLVAHLGGDGGG